MITAWLYLPLLLKFGINVAKAATISSILAFTAILPSNAITTFASGLNEPLGITFDSSGNLYVALNGSNTIDKITPGGATSTFASGLNSIPVNEIN